MLGGDFNQADGVAVALEANLNGIAVGCGALPAPRSVRRPLDCRRFAASPADPQRRRKTEVI